MRSVQHRLEKLEAARLPAERTDRVLAVVPLSDGDVDQDTIQQWIDDGFAHVAGGVIVYDGGEHYPLTIEEWETRYCAAADSVPLIWREGTIVPMVTC
jgi:hypothetical protein